jgi:hypothetical protein
MPLRPGPAAPCRDQLDEETETEPGATAALPDEMQTNPRPPNQGPRKRRMTSPEQGREKRARHRNDDAEKVQEQKFLELYAKWKTGELNRDLRAYIHSSTGHTEDNAPPASSPPNLAQTEDQEDSEEPEDPEEQAFQPTKRATIPPEVYAGKTYPQKVIPDDVVSLPGVGPFNHHR